MSTESRQQQELNEAAKATAAAVAEPQAVPVNVYRTDEAVVVVAPLPAVQPEDVRLTATDGSLLIEAELRSPALKNYLVQEWTYGPYRREAAVPPGYGNEIQASLANGQLAVRLLPGSPPEEGRVVQLSG